MSAKRGDTPGTARSELSRAARWRLIALLLRQPREGWLAEMRSLSAELGDEDLAAAVAAAEGATEGNYLRLFGPGGAVSPREVAYRPMGSPGAILADLAARYRAFAYRPTSDEPLDHVAVEVDFLGYLELKAAYARACGDEQALGTVSAEVESFVGDHLAELATGLADRLAGAPVEPCGLAARRLRALLPGSGARALPVVDGNTDPLDRLDGLDGLDGLEDGCCGVG